MPALRAPKESVIALLRSTERHLLKDPQRAIAYKAEMQKLINAGLVREVIQENPRREVLVYSPSSCHSQWEEPARLQLLSPVPRANPETVPNAQSYSR